MTPVPLQADYVTEVDTDSQGPLGPSSGSVRDPALRPECHPAKDKTRPPPHSSAAQSHHTQLLCVEERNTTLLTATQVIVMAMMIRFSVGPFRMPKVS